MENGDETCDGGRDFPAIACVARRLRWRHGRQWDVQWGSMEWWRRRRRIVWWRIVGWWVVRWRHNCSAGSDCAFHRDAARRAERHDTGGGGLLYYGQRH